MSSIDSLKLISPVNGETIYTSPSTDLRNMNSLSYSALYAHASLSIANLELLFSVDDINFEVYETITLQNEVKTTYNSVIPSRYFRFRFSNPAPDAMVETNIIFYAHSSATQNIDVNLSSPHDTIDVSGNFALETTQLAVKGVLDDIKLNTDKLPRVGGVIYNNDAVIAGTSTTPIDMGEYNVIQVSGRVAFDSNYNFVLQFGRAEVGNYFSDNIEANIKRLGTTAFATFSLTRTNVAHQFVRLYNLVGGDEVFLEYDLLKN